MQLVLAASSEDYLMQLQTLLLEQCGQLKLEIISDYNYLETYFKEDRKPDLLLISEGYYNRMRKNGTLGAAGRLPATRVFLLSKEGTKPEGLPYGVRVPRDCAAHLPALVRQLYASKPKPEAARLSTRLITVHSPLFLSQPVPADSQGNLSAYGNQAGGGSRLRLYRHGCLL